MGRSRVVVAGFGRLAGSVVVDICISIEWYAYCGLRTGERACVKKTGRSSLAGFDQPRMCGGRMCVGRCWPPFFAGAFAGKKGGVHRKSRALWLNEARVRAYVFICRASACQFLSLVNSYRSTTELTRHVRTACGGRWRGRVRDTASEWVRAGAGGLAARQFVQPTAARWHHFEPPTRQKKWQKKTNRSLSTNYSCFPRLQSIVIDQSSFAPNVEEDLQAQQPTGGRLRICPRSHHPSPPPPAYESS